MNENNSWLIKEVENLDLGKPSVTDYPEPLKLLENKITEITVDFSLAFDKKPNKTNPEVLQALIPVVEAGKNKVFWLNVSNPLYGQIVRAGKNGITKFKILRTGTQKATRYTILE